MAKSKTQIHNWIYLLLLALIIPVASFLGRSQGEAANSRELNSERDTPVQKPSVIVKVARQDAPDGATNDQIDDQFAKGFGSYLADQIYQQSAVVYQPETSILRGGPEVFAEVRLTSAGETHIVQLATIQNEELVRVTCAAAAPARISIETTECAAKIRETFGIDVTDLERSEGSQFVEPKVQDDVSPRTKPGAFTTHEFEGGISVRIPSHWKPLEKNISDDILVYAEAMTEQLNLEAPQSRNQVLIAASALDDSGGIVATARLSVRSKKDEPEDQVTQAEMRAALKDDQKELRMLLLAQGESLASSMSKAPVIKYYKLRDAGLDNNGVLVCTWSSFEYDDGMGATITDSWICPAGDRTIKLTTSYSADKARLYAPIIDHVWKSFKAD